MRLWLRTGLSANELPGFSFPTGGSLSSAGALHDLMANDRLAGAEREQAMATRPPAGAVDSSSPACERYRTCRMTMSLMYVYYNTSKGEASCRASTFDAQRAGSRSLCSRRSSSHYHHVPCHRTMQNQRRHGRSGNGALLYLFLVRVSLAGTAASALQLYNATADSRRRLKRQQRTAR